MKTIMSKISNGWPLAASVLLLGGILLLTYQTQMQLKAVPKNFGKILAASQHPQFLDRYGEPLNITYENRWNVHNALTMERIPLFLKQAFIVSEDKRFYQHQGPDWLARLAAVWANLSALRKVRGASTISEQVVRMLRPRPRTLWSRWLEGFEATRLEEAFSKDAILNFYLNQVPYASNRRGVAQAARYYFNRDVQTLSKREMLALVILVRAPSRYHLWRNPQRIDGSIARLADNLVRSGVLSTEDKQILLAESFQLQKPQLAIKASAFIKHADRQSKKQSLTKPVWRTSLDGPLQKRTQAMLDARLRQLKRQSVNNGGVLAVDHISGEILVWAVGGADKGQIPGSAFDAITTPRQPGSALKPFLYALALSRGFTAATRIDDTPTSKTIGHGLHHYQNYSRQFYGPVTLRQALGNSLNTPAVSTLRILGEQDYLNFLHDIGFHSLQRRPEYYGDGLALGNGEVSLLELVQGYALLANQGRFKALQAFFDAVENPAPKQVVAPEVASLIADILSDPGARELEFGRNSILNFPVQTAVKTGTSSDYRDSWALGFNDRYTVGVWLGNLNQEATDGITGSTGPALLLRSVFAELNQFRPTQPLVLHHKLKKHFVCDSNQRVAHQKCSGYWEWFIPGTEPSKALPEARIAVAHPTINSNPTVSLQQPTPGLHLAIDPRQPESSQAFEFFIAGVAPEARVQWTLNEKIIRTRGGRYLWPLEQGAHVLSANVWQGEALVAQIGPTHFWVK